MEGGSTVAAIFFSHSECQCGMRLYCHSCMLLLICWPTYLAQVAASPIATPVFAKSSPPTSLSPSSLLAMDEGCYIFSQDIYTIKVGNSETPGSTSPHGFPFVLVSPYVMSIIPSWQSALLITGSSTKYLPQTV